MQRSLVGSEMCIRDSATPVGSAPESDLPPLDATHISLLEAPAGAPLRPMQAAAPILREELAAVAAREAAEAAEGAAVAAIVSTSQLAEERGPRGAAKTNRGPR